MNIINDPLRILVETQAALIWLGFDPMDEQALKDNKMQVIGCMDYLHQAADSGELKIHNKKIQKEFIAEDGTTHKFYNYEFTLQSLMDFAKIKNHPLKIGKTPALENLQSDIFNKNSLFYPPELDFALQAWRAVASTEGKGKPKARIRAWLDANTRLSNEAKDRISIVANWDKSGGSTRTY